MIIVWAPLLTETCTSLAKNQPVAYDSAMRRMQPTPLLLCSLLAAQTPEQPKTVPEATGHTETSRAADKKERALPMDSI